MGTVREDSWLFSYLMIVVVGNLAILHYANALRFTAQEEVEKEKEKTD